MNNDQQLKEFFSTYKQELKGDEFVRKVIKSLPKQQESRFEPIVWLCSIVGFTIAFMTKGADAVIGKLGNLFTHGILLNYEVFFTGIGDKIEHFTLSQYSSTDLIAFYLIFITIIIAIILQTVKLSKRC